MAILLLPLVLLSIKVMVYTYDIISLALDKLHDKLTDKINKM